MSEDPSNFTELDAATAERLCEQQEHILDLDGLTELTDEAANALRGWDHTLSLDGLSAISANAAAAITSDKRSEISLDGLATLGDDVARALGRFEGTLYLDGVTSITTTEALALSDHRHHLYMTGLLSSSDEALCHLSMHPRIALNAELEASMRTASPWQEVGVQKATGMHLRRLDDQPRARTSKADDGARKLALDLLSGVILGQTQDGYLDSIPNDLYEIQDQDLDQLLERFAQRWQDSSPVNQQQESLPLDNAIAAVRSFLGWCRKERMCPKLSNRVDSLGRR